MSSYNSEFMCPKVDLDKLSHLGAINDGTTMVIQGGGVENNSSLCVIDRMGSIPAT